MLTLGALWRLTLAPGTRVAKTEWEPIQPDADAKRALLRVISCVCSSVHFTNISSHRMIRQHPRRWLASQQLHLQPPPPPLPSPPSSVDSWSVAPIGFYILLRQSTKMYGKMKNEKAESTGSDKFASVVT